MPIRSAVRKTASKRGKEIRPRAIPLEKRVAATRRGLSTSAVQVLAQQLGVPQQTLLDVVGISRSSLSRRERLLADESDRLSRVADVYRRVRNVVGDEESARRWLTQPCLALGDLTPLSLLDTDEGTQAVRDEITRIQWGVFA